MAIKGGQDLSAYLTIADAATKYLKLDCSNDPLTAELEGTSFTDGTATLTGGALTGVTGGIQLDADNAKVYFGAGDDYSIYYSSSNLIINQETAGDVVVLGGGIGIGGSTGNSHYSLRVYDASDDAEVTIDSGGAAKRPAFFLQNDANDTVGFYLYGSAHSSGYADDCRLHMGNSAKDFHYTGMNAIYSYTDNHILADSKKLYFGAGDDASIEFDGTDWNLYNEASDSDITIDINDGGTQRTAIQVHGDSGILSFPQQVACRAYRTSDQVVTNGTQTQVSFDTEDYDIGGNFASDTFTAPEAGIYWAYGMVEWASPGASVVYWLQIIFSGGKDAIQYDALGGSTHTYLTQNVGGLFDMNAGQTLKLYVYTNSGSRTLKDIGAGESIQFSVVKVA